jgi:SAM-dependent methyltransferase
VTAVEPLPEMRERLVEAVPDVGEVLEGSAEAIPLPDRSADAVLVAQAFHWFDQPVALREIGRVLRPGGRLGLIWNIRDDAVDWVARLSERIGTESGDGDDDDEWAVIGASGLYGPVEEAEWHWEQPLDRTRLLDLVLSRSYCATLAVDERAKVLDAVGRLYDEAAGSGPLSMPYVTYGFRAERL